MANAPPAAPAKMFFEPPMPGTNSWATRLPPPDRSSVEPAATAMALPGASSEIDLAGGAVTAVPAYVQFVAPVVWP